MGFDLNNNIYYTRERSQFGGSSTDLSIVEDGQVKTDAERKLGEMSIDEILKFVIDQNISKDDDIEVLLLSSVHPQLLTGFSGMDLEEIARDYIREKGYGVKEIRFFHNPGYIPESNLAASSQGGAAINQAVRIIREEGMKKVAVLSLEHMSDRTRKNERTNALTSIIHPDDSINRMVDYGAMMRELLVPYRDNFNNLPFEELPHLEQMLRKIFIASRRNATFTDSAHLKTKFSEQYKDYQNGTFAFPYSGKQVCPASTGYAISVLQTTVPNDKNVTVIAGLGSGIDTRRVFKRPDPTLSNASDAAFHDAYLMANVNPGDISIAELHIAFDVIGISEMLNGRFYNNLSDIDIDQKGNMILPDGKKIFLNLSGSTLSSHAIGATTHRGVNEVSLQLKGESWAGNLGIGNGAYGLISGVGGPKTYDHVVILYTFPRDRVDSVSAGNEARSVKTFTTTNLDEITERSGRYHQFGEGNTATVVTRTYVPEGDRMLCKAVIRSLDNPALINLALSYDRLSIGDEVRVANNQGILHISKK